MLLFNSGFVFGVSQRFALLGVVDAGIEFVDEFKFFVESLAVIAGFDALTAVFVLLSDDQRVGLFSVFATLDVDVDCKLCLALKQKQLNHRKSFQII